MGVAFTSLLGAVSGYGMVSLFEKGNRNRHDLEEMKEAGTFSPHQLKTSFENPDFQTSSSINPDNPNERIIKTFLEGRVQCTNPVRSSIGNNSEVVYQITHREDIYSNELLESKKPIDPRTLSYGNHNTTVRAPLIFTIEDENKSSSCTVRRSILVDASDALVKLGENREMKKLTWADGFLIFLGALVEAIRTFGSKSSGTHFRGLKIGFTEREFGIKINSTLTVFGDIIYNSKDNSLRIDSPLYFMRDKLHGLRVVKEKMILNYVLAALSGVVFAACSLYLADRAKQYFEDERKKEIEQGNDKLNKIKSINLHDGYKCMVCKTQPRNVIIKPCLHFSLCKSCLDVPKKETCPVCNESIQETVDIFFS